ncbi:hypothetical protein LSUE1_G009100 [Lachnellula suecica]|uniref:Uncharacterized protein n=1 Tax=Lachnellula suecica TaxID=602035 RepID=A0A8T9BRL7_9HELO|nr:hypothetical protein LSUE1_G009100 [Lachnellula suecica]
MASQTEPKDANKLWDEQQLKERVERARQYKTNSRLSIPYPPRLLLATSLGFLAGAGMGISEGSLKAGYRFRAENAHRLPTSQQGWYFYHKSKNYGMGWGGLKEGVKMGARISFWTGGFFAIEDMFDRWRGTKDFINTVLASLVVSGSFSLWNRFPVATAARTAKTGLAIGLAFGLAQDAVGAAKGRTPGYVEFLLRGRRRGERAEVEQSGGGGV